MTGDSASAPPESQVDLQPESQLDSQPESQPESPSSISTAHNKATAKSEKAPRSTIPRRNSRPVAESRIAAQPGFVLHSYPHRETSLILDVFTRDYGRIALVAKGAKRPLSKLRGVLQTFQPLTLSWSGRSEIRTLTAAEWVGGMLPLEKSALLCGFYLNELLVKLLARDDAHPTLFNHYVATLNKLGHQEPAPIVLRQFERALLKDTGVSGDFTICTVTRQPVEPDIHYVVDPERGPRVARVSDRWPSVSGKTLLDMAREDYSDSTTQAQSKVLMRFLLAYHLGGTPLNTRQILIDLMQL
ncbi:DNA repair protein RecO [Glaciimonas immobilis]|uniref:DNA repair protein RecO n=1 Tax=Glaciimonas immobilis TaxID=728004 RepID=UPI0035D512B7